MTDKKLILIDEVRDNLLSNLDSRDVALWLQSLPKGPLAQEELVTFLGLPWRMVLSEVSDVKLVKALEEPSNFSDYITRKRGFVQIVDSDPSRIQFPQRCLPIYLLGGRQVGAVTSDFEGRLRRMTMLEDLRRSGVRQILIISGADDPVPPDLRDLWSSGFRSYLTFVSDSPNANAILDGWFAEIGGVAVASLSRLPSNRIVQDILARYAATYPEDRRVIRVRDQKGELHKVDVTTIDEPERPLLEQYSLIEDRDLTPLMPEELSEEDFIAFFRNPESSWRPYAAGLPWIREADWQNKLRSYLRKLDVVGSEENCVAYVSAEPGAGGTTIVRMLAWEYAREGYPVLIAKPLPFVPDALAVANFISRAHREIDDRVIQEREARVGSANGQSADRDRRTFTRPYETPWIIVFDRLHWEYRDSELRRFRNEMESQGRPVCILVVTGSVRELSYFDTSVFKQVADLNHTLDQDEARQLGRHLNQFLRVYGKTRQDEQWNRFYQDHTVRYLEGVSSFWITLSFWIQGQYDLSESIQEWMYRSFMETPAASGVREAILEIAAMSSERLPLPEGMLPSSKAEWPISHLLDDHRSHFGPLGLTRIASNGEKYWALIHDILGRFLINALFYDFKTREDLGYAEARDGEHLRFLLLRQISEKRELGERSFRAIGEDFATTIFKIDPDHGRGSFALFWREVLGALDSMPRPLRDTSRVFRHHTAVSRRRIAKLNESFYNVNSNDRITLLTKAIEDINYALNSIEYTPGSESNLNLYNSLANAYLDLAEVEAKKGSAPERIMELRGLANSATRKAYEESPTNSFVIETYVKNLLGNARGSPDVTIEYCIEALGILFSAIASNEAAYRRSQLGQLADEALQLLLMQVPVGTGDIEPASAIDVLVRAWLILAEGVDYHSGVALSEIPEPNRLRALDALGHSAGRGNMQVIRLSFELTCITYPHEFKRQLEFLEQLQTTDYRITPQLRLEYAILLYQNNRPVDGDRVFRSLRRLWREGEHFVYVPTRLRWLRDAGGAGLKAVQAVVASDRDLRAMARVNEFQNLLVPFRMEEFSIRDPRPGFRFAGHVSFGHNGPFLRPVTSGPPQTE